MKLLEFWKQHKEEIDDLFDKKKCVDSRLDGPYADTVGVYTYMQLWEKYGHSRIYFKQLHYTLGYYDFRQQIIYIHKTKKPAADFSNAQFLVRLWNGTMKVMDKKWPGNNMDHYKLDIQQTKIKL